MQRDHYTPGEQVTPSTVLTKLIHLSASTYFSQARLRLNGDAGIRKCTHGIQYLSWLLLSFGSHSHELLLSVDRWVSPELCQRYGIAEPERHFASRSTSEVKSEKEQGQTQTPRSRKLSRSNTNSWLQTFQRERDRFFD